MHVCAGVGVGVDAVGVVVVAAAAAAAADGGAGAGGDAADADGVGVGVGVYGCGDASGCAHGCDHVDVGSLLSFEEVVEAALLCLAEGEGEDGPAGVDVGAGEDGSGDTG